MVRFSAMVSVVLLLLLAQGGAPLREPAPLSARVANYDIQVRLDPTQHTLEGTERLRWRNDTSSPTSELYFHLYLNGLKNTTTALLQRSTELPDEWGAIDVESIQCFEPAAVLSLEPQADGTIARVALPRAVAPGETLTCKIQWTASLPRPPLRMGYEDDFYFVAHWFPKLGVFDGRRWKCHVFCEACEFFSDFGVYDVELTVPRGFVVGASGIRTGAVDQGNVRTFRYRAEDVHDFAWAASPRFLERTEPMDAATGRAPVEVRLLYLPEHAWFVETHLRLLRETLRDYGDWFGRYPYTTLTVVDPPDGVSIADEYPTFIGVQTPPSSLAGSAWERYVTVHELGHNWFYGTIATNEAEEPWLDEGVNQYVSLVALERAGEGGWLSPTRLAHSPAMQERSNWLQRGPGWDPLGKPAWAYRDWADYGAASYSQTATLLFSLERVFGRERLLGALAHYVRRYRFRHPGGADFIRALSEGLGADVAPLTTELMAGATWDYEVLAVRSEPAGKTAGGPWRNEVIVHRAGTLRHPVDVVARFPSGKTAAVRWEGRERWQRLSFGPEEPLTEATVDPGSAWLLDIDLANNGLRDRPEGLPAGRVSVGVAFWVEILLSALGF